MLSCCELFAVSMALDKGTGEIRAWRIIPRGKGARNPPSRELFTASIARGAAAARISCPRLFLRLGKKVLARYAPDALSPATKARGCCHAAICSLLHCA